MLVEDHFGDGGMWRVRWLMTNAWGVYLSELCVCVCARARVCVCMCVCVER
jgi:hypothetical protein